MRTLNTTLKRQWFDMIQSGEKKEEYREIKPYWYSRLLNSGNSKTLSDSCDNLKNTDSAARWNFDNRYYHIQKQFTHIRFTNGYSKNSPSFTIECNGIRIGRGNPDWGAPTDRDVFIISLGKIVDNA